MRIIVNKLIRGLGGSIAATAFVFAVISANSACSWYGYQSELPNDVKKLRKS